MWDPLISSPLIFLTVSKAKNPFKSFSYVIIYPFPPTKIIFAHSLCSLFLFSLCSVYSACLFFFFLFLFHSILKLSFSKPRYGGSFRILTNRRTMMRFVMPSSSIRVSTMLFIFMFLASLHFGSNAQLIPQDEGT